MCALAESQLCNFHRPRLPPIAKNAPIWFLNFESKSRISGGSSSASSSRKSQQQGHMRVKSSNQMVSLSDLSLADTASEFILLEYVEEHPVLMSNAGMASRIVNYFRPAVIEDTEEEQALDSADNSGGLAAASVAPVVQVDRNKSAVDAMHKKLGRIPRHYRCLLELSSKKNFAKENTFENDPLSDIPRLREGKTEVLAPDDDFPLLGVLGPNEIQPAIINNLFHAPLFGHQSKPTDYLLIRIPNKRGEKSLHFNVRALSAGSLFLVGQMEPQYIVQKPKKRTMNDFEKKYVKFHISKFFASKGNLDVTKKEIDMHFSYFAVRYKKVLNQLIDNYAVEYYNVQDPSIVSWRQKEHDPNAETTAELGDLFVPEDICLFERFASYEHQLENLGISHNMGQELEISKIETALRDRLVELNKHKQSQVKHIKSMIAKSSLTAATASLRRLLEVLEFGVRKCKEVIEVSRFIYQRCLVAPWNVSDNFVSVHKEGTLGGQLELEGWAIPVG